MPYDKNGQFFASPDNPNYTGTFGGFQYKNGKSLLNGNKNSIDKILDEIKNREESERQALSDQINKNLADAWSSYNQGPAAPVDPAVKKAMQEKQALERLERERRYLIRVNRLYWSKRIRLSGALFVAVCAASIIGFQMFPGGPVNQLGGLILASSPFAIVGSAGLFFRVWSTAKKSRRLTAEKAAQMQLSPPKEA